MFMEIFPDLRYNNPVTLYFILCEVKHDGSKTNIGLLPLFLRRHDTR